MVCLRGNHDAAALGQIDIGAFNTEAALSIKWLLSRLSQESLDFLGGLPEKKVIGQVTLAHGSPRNPVWEYILDTHTARSNFNSFDTPFCFIGHTHLPIIYQLDEPQNNVRLIVPDPGEKRALRPRRIAQPGLGGAAARPQPFSFLRIV